MEGVLSDGSPYVFEGGYYRGTLRDGNKYISTGGIDPYTIYVMKEYDHFPYERGWTYVDAGAHVGYWSIRLATMLQDQCRIYAVEPYIRNFECLVQNAKMNKHTSILPLNFGFWSSPGQKPLYIVGNPTGCSYSERKGFTYRPEEIVMTEVFSWDAFITKYNVEKVDLLKMDIEGSDAELFKGMNKVLPKRIIIAMEHSGTFVNNLKNEEVIALYTEKGYVRRMTPNTNWALELV